MDSVKLDPLSKMPLHQRIYTRLKQRIDAGEWGQGAVLPTENELCETYQVSRGTIRQVLAELEEEGLVRRERGRGTFLIRAGVEKPLQAAGHPTVSFIVPYVRDSFVSSILLGVESAARACGCPVVFSHVENNLEKQELALRQAYQQGVGGIILYPVNSNDAGPFLRHLIEQDFPLVLVDRYIRGIYADHVTSDNFGGGLMATQHLLSLGHRRIAFLSWMEMATTMEHRRAGYRQALQEAGIACEPGLEWEVKGYPEIELVDLEGVMFKDGFYKAFLFLAGPCRLCEKCAAAEDEPCTFPWKARPSMEGCGIDAFQTARNNGFFIETLSGKTDTNHVYALMMVD